METFLGKKNKKKTICFLSHSQYKNTQELACIFRQINDYKEWYFFKIKLCEENYCCTDTFWLQQHLHNLYTSDQQQNSCYILQLSHMNTSFRRLMLDRQQWQHDWNAVISKLIYVPADKLNCNWAGKSQNGHWQQPRAQLCLCCKDFIPCAFLKSTGWTCATTFKATVTDRFMHLLTAPSKTLS